MFPGLFIYQGMEHVTKGKDYLLKMNERWTLECYHKVSIVLFILMTPPLCTLMIVCVQPADRYVDDPTSEWCWDLSGAEEDVRLLFLVGSKLVNEDRFPQWRSGAEFKRS